MIPEKYFYLSPCIPVRIKMEVPHRAALLTVEVNCVESTRLVKVGIWPKPAGSPQPIIFASKIANQ
jgi:hypothetical protein